MEDECDTIMRNMRATNIFNGHWTAFVFKNEKLPIRFFEVSNFHIRRRHVTQLLRMQICIYFLIERTALFQMTQPHYQNCNLNINKHSRRGKWLNRNKSKAIVFDDFIKNSMKIEHFYCPLKKRDIQTAIPLKWKIPNSFFMLRHIDALQYIYVDRWAFSRNAIICSHIVSPSLFYTIERIFFFFWMFLMEKRGRNPYTKK